TRWLLTTLSSASIALSSSSLLSTCDQICPCKVARHSLGDPSSSSSPCAMIAMRGHNSSTSSTMCVERMTVTSRPMDDSRFKKRLRSAGSRPAVGSSTMMRRGLASSACAMPKRFLAHVPEVGLLQQRIDHRLALAGARDALQDGEMREHVDRRHLRIHAEFLRQIAEHFAHV